ncbi:GFA family protein, partial [Acidocella sp.]|uniref:GFA family protein n=1 Tax=Acidocella sp. TaxID=50710 RepID=UPI0026384B88
RRTQPPTAPQMVDQASLCPRRMALCRKPLTKPQLRLPPDRIVHRRLAKGFTSSAKAMHWFCPDCGTPLYMTDAQGRSIGVTLGSLDNPEAIRPTTQGWVCERVSWQALDRAPPAHENAPPYDL